MFDWLTNPVVKRLLSTGARALVVAAVALLVKHNLIDSAESEKLVNDLTPIVVAGVVALWELTKAEKRISVALNLPAGSTKVDLHEAMKAPKTS